MRAQTVDVKSSTGRVLCCTVFRPGGKKLLAKGHIISDEDVRVLESEGMESIWVTELEEGEVGEDDAVCRRSQRNGLRQLRDPPRGRRPGQPDGHRELLRAGGRRVAEADQLHLQRRDRHVAEFQLCRGRPADRDGEERAVRRRQGPAGSVVSIIRRSAVRSCRPARCGPRVSEFSTPIRSAASAPASYSRTSCGSGWSGSASTPNFVLACTEDENSVVALHAASAAVEAVRDPGGVDDGAGGSGRCDRTGDDPGRRAGRAIPGAG